ncbi:hypothetical protein U8326_06470 [Tsuneonella sp. CC-YZS046]|uniref:hypothetical protein n=1 Tax=Tsuneonella sp. CC-YZS046 TaxID=3042152 RepID=UPI002D7A1A6D|nr:hypothetical protein [Tsuneonella sp. CC-YZS046]WRO67795.1 hypothetical protein U8326_06470 [Tsuneonella sp. CC-YZS046]
MSSTRELARAEANLADAEAAVAEGSSNPYAEQNLAIHRRRVARLQAEMPPPAVPAAQPAPKPAPAALQPTGTLEQRLRRLARAMGGDEATLAAAIAKGTTPDAFALHLTDNLIARRKAAAEAAEIEATALRIAHPTPASVLKATADVEAIVARIANA